MLIKVASERKENKVVFHAESEGLYGIYIFSSIGIDDELQIKIKKKLLEEDSASTRFQRLRSTDM